MLTRPDNLSRVYECCPKNFPYRLRRVGQRNENENNRSFDYISFVKRIRSGFSATMIATTCHFRKDVSLRVTGITVVFCYTY